MFLMTGRKFPRQPYNCRMLPIPCIQFPCTTTHCNHSMLPPDAQERGPVLSRAPRPPTRKPRRAMRGTRNTCPMAENDKARRLNPVGWRMYSYIPLFASAGTFHAYLACGPCPHGPPRRGANQPQPATTNTTHGASDWTSGGAS